MEISVKIINASAPFDVIAESVSVDSELLKLALSTKCLVFEGIRYSTGGFYAGINEPSILKVSKMPRQF